MSPLRPRSIAILVTTFGRNAKLRRLVAQWLAYIGAHRGPNRYFVCVADSAANNAVELPPLVSYLVNTGEGFDDNLIGAFKALSGAADLVFAMGDDDLPNMLANPLPMIDAAIAANADADVLLFNHVSYRESQDIVLGDRYFRVGETVNLAVEPMTVLCHRLPRYCAIVYRMPFVAALLPHLSAFRGTLHAYAVPVLLAAAAGRFTFGDYPACLFDSTPKQDGAWTDADRVTDGLRRFLAAMRGHLSEADHALMRHGFEHNYFSAPVAA